MSAPHSIPPSMPFTCMMVDDDADYVAMLARLVCEAGGSPVICSSLAAARQEIERRSFDLVVLDNRLPDGTGFEFYPILNHRCPNSLVVMITGAPELSQAVELTRNGLFDFLTKPLDAQTFVACLERVRCRLGQGAALDVAEELIGDSGPIREVIQSLRQAARHSETTVLLLGETGTGKDLAARLLHRLTYPDISPAPEYVPLNCGSIPAEMFEAELFGSEKGAYTGSDRRRAGLVEAADGGTLFLDEVTEIPLLQQVKLLRFLESREYRLLGSTATRVFRGRVVAATNRRLDEEVQSGRFREDLRFRLDVFSVELPALRQRMEDLEPLAEYLLGKLAEKYQRRKPLLKALDLEALRTYHFPGNVRELRNLLERSLLRTPEDSATLVLDLNWLRTSRPTTPTAPTSPPVSARADLSLIDQQEYQLIRQALQMEGGGIRRAAARLGLTHQALLRRLQKWPELRQDIPVGRQ